MKVMQHELVERVKMEAEYIIKNNTTIRLTARRFKVSKTTVHKDVTERLFYIDRVMYKKVRKILDYNTSQKGIRGGNAMKKKFKK